MIHSTIRGLALYQIDTKCSTANIISSKNQSTKIQVPIVHRISKILLSHWYIKVHKVRIVIITEIIRGINFELLQKITKNLHET